MLTDYKESGFKVFRSGISSESIEQIQSDIRYLAECILNESFDSDLSTPELLSQIELTNPDAFFKLCLSVGDMASLAQLHFSRDFVEFQSQLNKFYKYPLVTPHAALFFNKYNVKRLQYGWHQESSYFTEHELGYHVWFPLFNDINVTGGPMLLKKGSHSESFEYHYEKEPNGLTQLRVPVRIVDQFETIRCELNVGDLVVFDHRIIHCTEEVKSKTIPRIAGIRRFVGTEKGYSSLSTSKTTADNTDNQSVIIKNAIEE